MYTVGLTLTLHVALPISSMSAITHTRLHTGSGEDFGPRSDGMVTLHTFENSDPPKNTIRDAIAGAIYQDRNDTVRSEAPTSEHQSLMRISYAVFCWTKTTNNSYNETQCTTHVEYN